MAKTRPVRCAAGCGWHGRRVWPLGRDGAMAPCPWCGEPVEIATLRREAAQGTRGQLIGRWVTHWGEPT